MKRLVAVSAFVAFGLVALPAFSQQRPATTAHFIDVGQAHATLLECPCHYGDAEGGPLDADVPQVGHHGSHNATTSELLDAVTPRVAVIPVGQWTFGRTGGSYITFAFGHPREDVVDLLSQYTNRRRTPAKTVKVAERARRFRDKRVASAIDATGWDGTVRVVARAQNDITVYREHQECPDGFTKEVPRV